MIYWISSNFLKLKNRPQKKVISIPNPGIQPKYLWGGEAEEFITSEFIFVEAIKHKGLN